MLHALSHISLSGGGGGTHHHQKCNVTLFKKIQTIVNSSLISQSIVIAMEAILK